MENDQKIFRPRRKLIRNILQRIIRLTLSILSDVVIEGQTNFPPNGPLIVVANHFSFLDPVAMIRATPMPIEFVGGFQLPNAPAIVRGIPKLWGYYPVFRGSVSRGALIASQEILSSGGVLGIFPEAGSWATTLRPARPGTAVLAIRTGSQVLPMGIDGATDFFPKIKQGKRPKLSIRIGKIFGPFTASQDDQRDKKRLAYIGDEIMRKIAELIPPERHGYYSDDPIIKESSKSTIIYPWENAPEGMP